jgi:hypothetical protein
VSWPDQGDLSAGFAVLVAIVVIFILIPRPWRWPALLFATAWAVIPIVRDQDVVFRVLLLSVVVALSALSYLVVDLWTRPARIRRDALITLICLAPVVWTWLEFGAPLRLPVLVVLSGSLIFAATVLMYGRHGQSTDKRASAEPIPDLPDLDLLFLKGLYRAAGGRVDHAVATHDLFEKVELPFDLLTQTAERLLAGRYVKEDGGMYSLRRKGMDVVESNSGRFLVKHGDSYTFEGPATGVFGRQKKVENNTFNSTNVPPDLITAIVAHAADLRPHLTTDQQTILADAVEDVRDEDGNITRRRRGAERLAAIAEAAGDVGEPLLRVAGEVARNLAEA